MMDVQTFASQIKQKYPQYNSLSDQDLVNKVVAKYPQYKDQVNMGGSSQVGGALSTGAGILRGLGLGAIPTGISSAMNMPSEVGAVVGQLTGNQAPVQQYKQKLMQDPLANPDLKQAVQTQNPQQAAQAFQSDSGTTGFNAAMNIPSDIGAVAGIAKNAPSYLTKPGVNKLIEKAAADATTAGKNVQWGDLSNNIRKAVIDKFGNSASVHKALESFLAEETPALQGEVKKGTQLADSLLNPTELLKKRRTISTRISSPFFSKLAQALNPSGQSSAGQLDQSIANEARRIVSDKLKELAPDIKTPDKLYSFYSKIKGDVPTWGKRAAGIYVAEQLLGNKLGGLPKDLVDGLGLLLGGV